MLENALGLTVPLETMLAVPTAQGAADALMVGWLAQGREPDLVRDRVVMAGNGAGVV